MKTVLAVCIVAALLLGGTARASVDAQHPSASTLAQADGSVTSTDSSGTVSSDAPVRTDLTPEPSATKPSPASGNVHLTPERRTGFGLQLGTAIATGIVSVPLGLGLAAWLGTLSNSLIWAAVPTLLAMGLVAPTLTTLAAWLAGNWNDPGRFGFWLPWVATSLANIVGLVVAGFAGFSVGVPVKLALFSILQGAVLGGVSVGTMRLFSQREDGIVSTLPSFAPGIAQTTLVPLGQVHF